jgi:hypothetical protein
MIRFFVSFCGLNFWLLHEFLIAILPRGTVGYPPQPRLISLSFCHSIRQITFSYSAEKRPGPTEL